MPRTERPFSLPSRVRHRSAVAVIAVVVGWAGNGWAAPAGPAPATVAGSADASVAATAAGTEAAIRPAAGILYGYEIGTTYPVTAGTRHAVKPSGLVREVIADDPAAAPAAGGGQVRLLTTVGSHTIVSVWSKHAFPSAHEADVFATRWAAKLKRLTGQPGQGKVYDYQRYRAAVGPDGAYLLTINVFLADDRSAMYVVIGLKDNAGPTGELHRRIEREWRDAVEAHQRDPSPTLQIGP